MSKAITTAAITDLVRASFEPREPYDTIVEVLRPYNGKKFTKRHLDKLKEALPAFHFWRAGIVDAINWGPAEGPGEGGRIYVNGGCLDPIDVDRLKDENVCYYRAADERNEARAKLLASPARIFCVAKAIEDYVKAKAAMAGVLDTPPVSVARYQILEAAGIDWRI